jgi:DNA replication protein DnaC
MQTEPRSTWKAYPPAAARDDCSMCRGTGWLLQVDPGFVKARRCSCIRLSRLLEIRDKVRIPERYCGCTLSNYSPQTPAQVRALFSTRRFASSYPAPTRDLFLVGGPGVGKTHLAVGIVRELLNRFVDDAAFLDFEDFLSLMLDRSVPHSHRQAEWARAWQTSLLVLDDFGASAPSPARVRVVEDLILGRLRARRHTIFTGEPFRCRSLFAPSRGSGQVTSTQRFMDALSPECLMALLSHVRIVCLAGPDFRRKKAAERPLFG